MSSWNETMQIRSSFLIVWYASFFSNATETKWSKSHDHLLCIKKTKTLVDVVEWSSPFIKSSLQIVFKVWWSQWINNAKSSFVFSFLFLSFHLLNAQRRKLLQKPHRIPLSLNQLKNFSKTREKNEICIIHIMELEKVKLIIFAYQWNIKKILTLKQWNLMKLNFISTRSCIELQRGTWTASLPWCSWANNWNYYSRQ